MKSNKQSYLERTDKEHSPKKLNNDIGHFLNSPRSKKNISFMKRGDS